MYRLNYNEDFQKETGYTQECNLLFADFLDAIKHVRDVLMRLYPSITAIHLNGFLDDVGNFQVTIPDRFSSKIFKTYYIATITLA